MSLYLATLLECKNDLGITDNQDDSALLRLGENIQGRFDVECQRRLLFSDSVTEYFDGGCLALWVSRPPLSSVASLHVSSEQDWTSDNLLVEADDDYRVDYSRGRIVYGAMGAARWPEGVQNIRVVYAGGFVRADGTAGSNVDAGELAGLRRAFLMQFVFEWRNRMTIGLNSISAQGVNVNVAPAKLLPDVAAILAALRRF